MFVDENEVVHLRFVHFHAQLDLEIGKRAGRNSIGRRRRVRQASAARAANFRLSSAILSLAVLLLLLLIERVGITTR